MPVISPYWIYAVERQVRSLQNLLTAEYEAGGGPTLVGEALADDIDQLSDLRDFLWSVGPTTREQILEFSRAFQRPVNHEPIQLSPEDRLLLGALMLEEVVEYLTKGLGLRIGLSDLQGAEVEADIESLQQGAVSFDLELNYGQAYDPIESADGLADINVVAHFNSNWHGWNLDRVTSEVHRSNMSKLGEDGKPIINGETPGYEYYPDDHEIWKDTNTPSQFDPSKPRGKILKGPNYHKPDIASVIYSK